MDLRALYAAVPAAQEEDLLEEVAAEHAEERWQDLASTWVDAPLPDVTDEQLPEDEPSGLTHHQALGLLAHELGAEPLD